MCLYYIAIFTIFQAGYPENRLLQNGIIRVQKEGKRNHFPDIIFRKRGFTDARFHSRRFPPDHRARTQAVSRACGAHADFRLSLPPQPGRDLRKQAVLGYRRGLACGGSLQVACPARKRRAGGIRHRKRQLSGQVRPLRCDYALPHWEPHLSLVPSGAQALLRH